MTGDERNVRMEHWWNDTERWKIKCWEKSLPSVTLSTTNCMLHIRASPSTILQHTSEDNGM